MDPNILSIILYGSRARHDYDNLSDIDLCIFTKERRLKEIKDDELKKIVSKFQSNKVNLAIYPSSVFDLMLESGSLFLWHLKLEGKVLFGEKFFSSKIKKLQKFRNHLEEIEYHSELYYDLIKSWKSLVVINELDLSTLFTITRNTLMILAHYSEKPVFGRNSCFVTAKKLFPSLPIEIDDYKYLASWKIIYERNFESEKNLPKFDEYEKLIITVGKVLEYAANKLSN